MKVYCTKDGDDDNKPDNNIYFNYNYRTNRPPLWSSGQEFLATDPEVPGSISGATRFTEK
jgi:hypothetical protein